MGMMSGQIELRCGATSMICPFIPKELIGRIFVFDSLYCQKYGG
jgi:hypothetical protein